MLSLKGFINESTYKNIYEELEGEEELDYDIGFIVESKSGGDDDSGDTEDDSKAKMGDITGKLHELLVGYHLQHGKHMEAHPDSTGLSPEESHAKHVKLMQKKDPNFEHNYKILNDRAKAAADHIRSHVEAGGRKVTKVHWTSTGSAVTKSTGIKGQTGKNNASDIVIHSHKEGTPPDKAKPKFIGVSLKKNEKNSPETTSSNLGASSLHPKATEELAEFKRKRVENYKSMPKASGEDDSKNSAKRAEWLAKRPKTAAKIERENRAFVQKTAKSTAKHLNSLPQEELHHHVKSLLSAHHNEMHGMDVGDGSGDKHELIKHTTYGDVKGEAKHQLIKDIPAHYEHLFNDPKHKIKVVHQKNGTINFKHKGKSIISQTVRLADNKHIMPKVKSVASPLVGSNKSDDTAPKTPKAKAKPKKKLTTENIRYILNLINERR